MPERDYEMILEEVFRHTPVGVALVDLHGTIFDANPALGRILHLDPATLVGTNFGVLLEDGDDADFESLLVRLREGAVEIPGKLVRLLDSRGISVAANLNLSVVESSDPEPAWCVAFVENVDHRVRMEDQLRDSEDRYRRIVEDQVDLISRSLPDGTLLFVNDAYCRHYGVSREDVIGRSFYEFVDEADRDAVRRKIASLTPERPVAQNEHRVRERDGRVGWQRWIDRGFFEDGELIEIQSVGHDITEEREARERVRKSEERFRGLFRNLPIAVWESDWSEIVKGLKEFGLDSAESVPSRASETVRIFETIGTRIRINAANSVALQLAGVETLEEFQRWLPRAYTPDSMRRFLFAAKALLFEGKKSIVVPVTMISSDGRETEGIVRTSRLADSPSDWRMIVVAQDLTEFTRIGRELRERQELIARIEAAAHVGSWEWTPESNVIRGSAEFWQILTGSTRGESERRLKDLLEFVHPDDVEELRGLVLSALNPGDARPDAVRREFRLVRPDGSTAIVRASIFYWYGERGAVDRAFGTLQNVTELKRAELEAERHREEMIRADKMISLGILVSGVAHEINNPNHSIVLNLPLLRDAWRDTTKLLDAVASDDPGLRIAGAPWKVIRDEIPDVLNDVEQASDRIRTIVAELKGFAVDREKADKKPTSINAVVESALRLLSNIVKKSTTNLQVELDADLPLVCASEQRLEQVVVNLVVNACQALESNEDAVTIRTSRSGDEVLVTVIDQGIGIAAEDMNKILDPFFTTKRNTGGTGLGLAVSQRIVEDHGGRLTFESEPGRGTTAVLALPIRQEEVCNG